MKRLKKHRQRQLRPIPYVISFHLTFLPEDLDDWEYEKAVRKIVREKLPEDSWGSGGLWEEYDPFVSDIIQEELCKN